jgi:hypothetical protein
MMVVLSRWSIIEPVEAVVDMVAQGGVVYFVERLNGRWAKLNQLILSWQEAKLKIIVVGAPKAIN